MDNGHAGPFGHIAIDDGGDSSAGLIAIDVPADEDIHCTNMRKLGVIFHESDWDYHLKTTKYEDPQDRYQKAAELGKENFFATEEAKHAEKFIKVFEWPTAGGIWTPKVSTDKSHSLGVRNAFTMDEKCRTMEMIGADLSDCPGLDLGIDIT